MTEKEKFEKFYENGYLSHVKILYSSGGYKYANLFSLKNYEMGEKDWLYCWISSHEYL